MIQKKGTQFIRGGQIFDYKTKMMVQVTNRIATWAIAGYALLVCCLMAYTSFHELKLVGLHYYCDFLSRVGFGDQVVWHSPHGGVIDAHFFLTSHAIQGLVRLARATLVKHGVLALSLGGVIYFGIVWYFTRFFIQKGEKYSNDKLISGTRLATSTKR